MASPNGQLPNTPVRNIHQQDARASPRLVATDSPLQRHFLDRSSQILEQTNQRYDALDKEASRRGYAYLNAIDAAAAEHERVRREAQEAEEREWMILEAKKKVEKEEALRQLQRERQQLEALNKEREEEHQRELERRRQAEEASRRLAEEEKAAAAARIAAEEAEKQRRLEQKAKEEEAAKEAAAQREQAITTRQQSTQQGQQTNGIAKPRDPFSSPTAPAANSQPAEGENRGSRDAEHQRYLALHKALKQLRKDVVAQSKSNPTLKNRMGEMRREIRKSVGQLTAETQARKIPLSKIRTLLNEAQKIQQPSIDVAPFIISQPLPQVEAAQRQISGLLLYLLNIFSKSVIAQFIDETGADSRTADPIGIVAISIFAAPDFRWQGLSLIDMLVAKFHVVCPVLFGIYASDKTEVGRARIGWRRDPDTGGWVSEQRHSERMTGLGSGFGALTLRNFANAKSTNPYPPGHYWRAIAGIVNTPPPRVTQTQCTVLRALIEHHVERFISFYGAAAIAVLRRAVVELPREVEQSTAASALGTLGATIRRDLHLAL